MLELWGSGKGPEGRGGVKDVPVDPGSLSAPVNVAPLVSLHTVAHIHTHTTPPPSRGAN